MIEPLPRSPRQRRRSSAAARAAAIAIGSLSPLLAAEAVLRCVPEESLGFRYENGAFARPREFREDAQRNAWGFHDVEPPAAQDAVPRVLLLGDSYVAALSVPIEQTVGRRLASELARDERGALQVVAFGLPGWGQREELEALRTLGPAVAPALVLTLFLPFNDVRDNAPALDERADRELEALARFRPGWMRLRGADAPWFLCEASRLNQWLAFELALRRERGAHAGAVPLDYEVYATHPDPTWADAWSRTEALLRETAQTARACGARYAVAIASTPHGVLGASEGLERLRRSYPALRERELDLTAPTRRLERFLRDEGIPCLDLEAPFAAEQARRNTPLHWPRDGHWNAEGNALAARLLEPFVRRALE